MKSKKVSNRVSKSGKLSVTKKNITFQNHR